MKTKLSNKLKDQLRFKLSRLSTIGITAFLMMITFSIFIIFLISKTEDFPQTSNSIDIQQSWTRGEYKKIYSYFLNEMNKLKYWQAYHSAQELRELDKTQLTATEENKLLVEVVAQAVPSTFKDYAENRISFEKLIDKIKNRYMTFCPNVEQAEGFLKYGDTDNLLLDGIPKWVLTSGFEAEIASERSDFRDYAEFIKLRMLKDLKKETSKEISKHIDENFYSFRQFMSRSILRNFGRRILNLPEKYTFLEKERQMSFDEKIKSLQILFAFIRDNVAIVKPDSGYVPTYPLDTLYRGYADLKCVNYLFSDLISAVLNIDSFEVSFPDSNACPLMCTLFDANRKRYFIYGFDFENSIPLVNNNDEMLDFIDFYHGSQTENQILNEHCDYIQLLKKGRNLRPKFYANMFQLEPRISLYLNNDIDLDVRPLPTSKDSFKLEIMLKNWSKAINFAYTLELLARWGEIQPSKLAQVLFITTSHPNQNIYFNALTSNKATSLNLQTRKIAFIFGWTEDASTSFSAGETDYLTGEHTGKYIRDYNMLMLNNVDRTAALLPFQGTAFLFGQTLIENYKQFKLSALQSLYQSGIMYMNQNKFQKAAICFTDFIKKCESETELILDTKTFPGVYIDSAHFLIAKCNSLIGNIAESRKTLENMIKDERKTLACKIALRYGFGNINWRHVQTQNNK